MTVYKAKVDTWLIIMVIVVLISMYFPLFTASPAEWGVLWVDWVISILVTWFVLDTLFCTRYTIDGEKLKVRCSIIRKSCRIDAITEIRKTRTWLSSPAPSLDRIQIRYGKYDMMIISPLEKEKFIAHLCELNPRIKVVKN